MVSIFPFRSLIYLEYIFVYDVMKYSNFILIFLLERTCTLSSTVSWKSLSRVQLFATLWTKQSMEFSRQNTRVDSLSLLQGIVPTQGSNPGLPHCRWILYQLSHKGNPRILEWVGYHFSSGSSWRRNWTRVSYIAAGFFTNWDIREVLSTETTFIKCLLYTRSYMFFLYALFHSVWINYLHFTDEESKVPIICLWFHNQ